MGHYDLNADPALVGLEGNYTISANGHTIALNERVSFGRRLKEFYKVASIDGLLDTPQVRGDRQPTSGDHGVYRGSQFLDERVVAFTGETLAGNFRKLREMQADLAAIGGPSKAVPKQNTFPTPNGWSYANPGVPAPVGSLKINPLDVEGLNKPGVQIGRDYGYNYVINPDFDPDYPTHEASSPGDLTIPYDWQRSSGCTLTNAEVPPGFIVDGTKVWGSSAGRMYVASSGASGDQWIAPGFNLWTAKHKGNAGSYAPLARLMPVAPQSSWHLAASVIISALTAGATVKLRIMYYNKSGTLMSWWDSPLPPAQTGTHHLHVGGTLPQGVAYIEPRLIVNFTAAAQTVDLLTTNWVLGMGETLKYPLFPSHPCAYQRKTSDGRAPNGYTEGPRPHNLLTDPSFEYGGMGWRGRSNTTLQRVEFPRIDENDPSLPVVIGTGSDKDGRKWAARTLRNTGTASQGIEQDVPVTPGVEYTMSAYLRGVTTNRGWRIHIDWLDYNSAIMSTDSSTALISHTEGWARSCKTATAPAGAVRAMLRIQSDVAHGPGEEWYIDNAMFNVGGLKDYADEFTPAWRGNGRKVNRITNLFRNPDASYNSPNLTNSFANGSTTGVTVTGPAGDDTWWGPNDLNKSSVRLIGVNSDATSRTALLRTNAAVAFAMPVTPGKAYYASSWMKVRDAGTTGTINFDINWYNATGASIGDTSQSTSYGPGEFFMESVGVAPSNAAFAALRWYTVFSATAGATADFSVDSIMFTNSVEPVHYVDGNMASWESLPNDSSSTMYTDDAQVVSGSHMPPPFKYELTQVDYDVKQNEKQDSQQHKRPFLVTARCADPRIYIDDTKNLIVQPRINHPPYVSQRNPGTFAGTDSGTDTSSTAGTQLPPMVTYSGYTAWDGSIPTISGQTEWLFLRKPNASVDGKTRMAFTEFRFSEDDPETPLAADTYASVYMRYKDASNFLEARYYVSGLLQVRVTIAGTSYLIEEYSHYQIPLGTKLWLRGYARDDGNDIWVSASVHDQKPGPSVDWWENMSDNPNYSYSTGMYVSYAETSPGVTLTQAQIDTFRGVGPYYHAWGGSKDFQLAGGSLSPARTGPEWFGFDEHEQNPTSLLAKAHVNGGLDTPFKLRIDGPVVHPFVTDSSGSFKLYTDITLEDDDFAEIDLITHKFGGVNNDPAFPGGTGQFTARNILQGSMLTNLNPGEHTFLCGGSGMTTGDMNTDTTRFTFSWRDAVR